MSQEMTIEVIINGEPKQIGAAASLQDLIEHLDLPKVRIAVEHNLEIVPRARWSATTLAHGDKLEIVHFVGGG